VRGCEEVTGLQAFWSADLTVESGGHFINYGTAAYTRVTKRVNVGGFSDQTCAGCAADYSGPCNGEPERPGASQATGSLNVYANVVAATTVGGCAALRMYDVQLARNIRLDNEWQVAGSLSWQGGLVRPDRADPSHFLYLMKGSTVTGDTATRRMDGYAGWSGSLSFSLPIGNGTKTGRAVVTSSCGSLFKAA
jgi:hypothetical protein